MPPGTFDACCGKSRSLRKALTSQGHDHGGESDHSIDVFLTPNKSDPFISNLVSPNKDNPIISDLFYTDNNAEKSVIKGKPDEDDKKNFDLADIRLVVADVFEKSNVVKSISAIESCIKQLGGIISTIRGDVMVNTNAIADIKADVTRIDESLQVIQGVVDDSIGNNELCNDSIMQSCITEVHEQQMRSKNLILYGLVEDVDDGIRKAVSVTFGQDGSSLAERSKDVPLLNRDFKVISELIDTSMELVGNNAQLESYTYSRLDQEIIERKKDNCGSTCLCGPGPYDVSEATVCQNEEPAITKVEERRKEHLHQREKWCIHHPSSSSGSTPSIGFAKPVATSDNSSSLNTTSNYSYLALNKHSNIIVIKHCKKELLYPLKILFDCILKSGVFPDYFKVSRVTPIYKGVGRKDDVKNSRPITVLSALSKVFEKCMYSILYSYFKPFVSSQQHGFLPRRSTVTNLAILKEYIISAFECGCQVDVIYTDFSKAFDKVSFNELIISLYGIRVLQNI
ncbi:uncharacterized protein LOC122850374 [Aphidius gifuensis]|uniref:uncharacterized protein LOC122850374 n=1 Tax=Aphidius gifuensis TaxID=684658 RepID=UPI001CDC1AEE|nr:uncharacterized protein LOC122850374 [Aphidius gifuensis]